MRARLEKSVLLMMVTILLTLGYPALAEHSDAHSAKSWLDLAVSEQHCPVTPVNLAASLGENTTDALRKRITISGGTLFVKGTDNPDHIVVSSGRSARFVDIAWNAKHIGRFGPLKAIELRGHGGDDVLIVKSGVSLPVLIDGGSGDDCLQGGSGADQLLGGPGNDVLIAGTGRPALDGGSGSDRVVVPRHMGTLRFAPAADSGVLRLLGNIYDLEPLSKEAGGSRKVTPSPVIVGSADLGDEQILSQLHNARAAAQSIVLTNGTTANSARLGALLGHPSSTKATQNNDSSTPGTPDALMFYRVSPRPGIKAYDYRAGSFLNLPSALNDWTVQLLSQVFSATAIVPKAPSGSPANDLQVLANSYTQSKTVEDGNGNSIEILNSVWAVRSFPKAGQSGYDYYYVAQTANYKVAQLEFLSGFTDMVNNGISSFSTEPTIVQTSPATTECSESTTTGTSWSIGGSAGWNGNLGYDAALTGGVSLDDSQTTTCPQVLIDNQTSVSSGQTQWSYQQSTTAEPALYTFYNQWIWQVPSSAYENSSTLMAFQSFAQESIVNGATVNLPPFSTNVPQPFDTFQLESPTVNAVNKSCVYPGDTFSIIGKHMYPSLVSSVAIGGTPLPSSLYTAATDTAINVVAPNLPAVDPQPVDVKTAVGESNDNVEITIPYLFCP